MTLKQYTLPIAITLVIIVIITLWEMYLSDMYGRSCYRNASTEKELVKACSKLIKYGNQESIDCFVDALFRTSGDNQSAIHFQLIAFCKRHWGEGGGIFTEISEFDALWV